ncbi:MAG: hypothetical protein ACM34D_11540 [Gemmatimonadota bacterium]
MHQWGAHNRLGPQLRSARLALGLLAPLAPVALAAQTVSPPIVEYQERARASFQLSNGSIFPLTVVLEPHGFDITENGDVVSLPFDTARIHLKLSATSFRLEPRATYNVFYDATADSLPAWFTITAAMSGARTDDGLNLRIILPHVVYLNQKQPLRKEDVVVRRLELDPGTKKVRVLLESLSAKLGRVLEFSVASAKGQSRSAGAFPLLPGHRRWAVVDWDLDQPPTRVMARFAKFSIDTTLAPTPPADQAAADTRSPDASRSGSPPPAGSDRR